MRVFKTKHLLLIIYRRKSQRFSFYRVHKDKYYDDIFMPLLERGFFQHLFGYICKNFNKSNISELIKTPRFRKEFCTYYKGDFTEPECNKRRMKKNFSVEELSLTDIFSKHELRQLINNYSKHYFYRVRRSKTYYWQFEKQFKKKEADVFRDFEIQQIADILIRQVLLCPSN